MWLSDICKNKCANAKVLSSRFLMKISLFADCVIYQNLPIVLYIAVIQLISNIINNFNTYNTYLMFWNIAPKHWIYMDRGHCNSFYF
jgi:hypothetical protein